MTIYSDLIPVSWTLLKRYCFHVPGGSYTKAAPAQTTHLRVTAMAAGGQGDNYGGSSAFVRKVIACAPGDSITGYVGQVSQATTSGDTWVRKNGVDIAYADRGRGTGPAGLAANSIGDLKIDGIPYTGLAGLGDPVVDPSTFSLFPTGRPSDAGGGVSPGAGGVNVAIYEDDGVTFVWWTSHLPAGPGRAFVEFYKGDPAH